MFMVWVSLKGGLTAAVNQRGAGTIKVDHRRMPRKCSHGRN
jgi:hypothetical protein